MKFIIWVHRNFIQFIKDDYDDQRVYAVSTLPTLQNTAHPNHI